MERQPHSIRTFAIFQQDGEDPKYAVRAANKAARELHHTRCIMGHHNDPSNVSFRYEYSAVPQMGGTLHQYTLK